MTGWSRQDYSPVSFHGWQRDGQAESTEPLSSQAIAQIPVSTLGVTSVAPCTASRRCTAATAAHRLYPWRSPHRRRTGRWEHQAIEARELRVPAARGSEVSTRLGSRPHYPRPRWLPAVPLHSSWAIRFPGEFSMRSMTRSVNSSTEKSACPGQAFSMTAFSSAPVITSRSSKSVAPC